MPRWDSFQQFLQEANQLSNNVSRQQLVTELLKERPRWPWIEGNKATFVHQDANAETVALNLDIIEKDPPFEPMVQLEGTDLWYVQRRFEPDDLLDYLIVVDDPMTPLRTETNLADRIAGWQPDDLNPSQVSNGNLRVSVLSMPQARPFPNWASMANVPNGAVYEHDFTSIQMKFSNRRLWVYTPPAYHDEPERDYPLLILLDGQWMVGPVQVPFIADAMIKHNRIEPIVIAMMESGSAGQRMRDYVSNDKQYTSLLTELVPLLQDTYRVDATNLGIGGTGVGAIAAAHAALKNAAVFSHLIMLSPPLGKGQMQQQLVEYADRFENARLLPERIFQSVGRYELQTRFYKPSIALAGILQRRQANRGDIDHKFVELGSGHGLAAFRSIMPEALAHTFPGSAFVG
ncbi:MAG: alpha/beta hydrolase-fold protein [Chloroflexota bacterium]